LGKHREIIKSLWRLRDEKTQREKDGSCRKRSCSDWSEKMARSNLMREKKERRANLLVCKIYGENTTKAKELYSET